MVVLMIGMMAYDKTTLAAVTATTTNRTIIIISSINIIITTTRDTTTTGMIRMTTTGSIAFVTHTVLYDHISLSLLEQCTIYDRTLCENTGTIINVSI
jgi:hypothetical protein